MEGREKKNPASVITNSFGKFDGEDHPQTRFTGGNEIFR